MDSGSDFSNLSGTILLAHGVFPVANVPCSTVIASTFMRIDAPGDKLVLPGGLMAFLRVVAFGCGKIDLIVRARNHRDDKALAKIAMEIQVPYDQHPDLKVSVYEFPFALPLTEFSPGIAASSLPTGTIVQTVYLFELLLNGRVVSVAPLIINLTGAVDGTVTGSASDPLAPPPGAPGRGGE